MLSQPATDPIISRLRPRSIQEILDQAFRLYRRYFFTFLAITAVVFVPVNMAVQLTNVALQGSSTSLQRSTLPGSSLGSSSNLSDEFLVIIVLFLLLMGIGIIGGLLQYLSQGALTSAVADSHLDRPISFGGAYRAMLKHVGPLLGAIGMQILIGIGVFLPAIVVFLLSIGTLVAGGDSAAGAGLMFLCLTFPALFATFFFYAYVFVRLTLIVPAIMVEDLGPVQAVRRSWQLVQGYWWRTFLLIVILAVINMIVSAGPAYLIGLLVAAITQSFDPVVVAATTGVVAVITEALFIPLSLTTYTLYYFDLRVRKEGFDLETALNQRYSYPGGPVPQGAVPGGYYAGQYGQYAPAGGYAPPELGYAGQPQYPTFNQQGYQYPQQGYSPPPGYSEPEGPSLGAATSEGAPTLPSSPMGLAVELSHDARLGPDTGPLEASSAEGLGFSTPSIAEQAAQLPSGANEPQPQPQPQPPQTLEADTLNTGSLEPPRHGDGPAQGER